ncbi:hypothetical protein, unlikely [Trypanosoma congolense IL3000]|uniref:Uncharacterized protein n=1 Tax=Trypanosoma congolense (strain IL3000) TaxID=1068625 RepID=F9WJM0_TRYCI|nr:hypothetical protein, unlikely [Trypanosoma congolense IL3000]
MVATCARPFFFLFMQLWIVEWCLRFPFCFLLSLHPSLRFCSCFLSFSFLFSFFFCFSYFFPHAVVRFFRLVNDCMGICFTTRSLANPCCCVSVCDRLHGANMWKSNNNNKIKVSKAFVSLSPPFRLCYSEHPFVCAYLHTWAFPQICCA